MLTESVLIRTDSVLHWLL